MKVHTASDKLRQLRRGVMELYISDHPLDCLTCAANGNCELQDAAGEVGLRDVRYGYDGANHLAAPTDESNPYFQFDAVEMHRLLALRAGVRGGAGHLRADHPGARLRLQGRRRDGRAVPDVSECVSCGACVQACPTATLMEKIRRRSWPAGTFRGHHLRLLRRRLQLQGGDARRHGGAHGAVEGRQGQPRPFLRQGPLRLGLCHAPRPHPEADDPREDHRSLARSELGRGDRPRRVASSSASRRSMAADAVGVITSSRCTNEETYLVQKLARAAFGNNNTDTCARVCHSPTGYGLSTTFGTSAGTQDFDSVEARRRDPGDRRQPDRRASGVRLAHEAAVARRARS